MFTGTWQEGHGLDVDSITNPVGPSREARERGVSERFTPIFAGMTHANISLQYTSPVGLKEAALDSPTFRATTLHFCDQIEYIEKWLDGYARAATKLSSELATLESVVGGFLSYSNHPMVVSEAVLDHDYTLLAMRRCGEGAKEMWNGLMATTKKMESLIAEPIRAFIHEDLRQFKVLYTLPVLLCLPSLFTVAY